MSPEDCNVCKYNKFGYCKFQNSCRKFHNNEICVDKTCLIEVCEKRHPKKCKYYTSYKNCKFGTFCKYFHDSTPFENDDKYERDSILERIENLQKEITDLTNSILEMKENLQTIYKESLYEILKCNECGKTFKSKAG